MNPGERFERVQELPFTKLGDQVLVVVARTREVHLLNETAARIWELLERESTLESLIESLREDYEMDPETGQREVGSIVTEMVGRGLLRSDGEAGKGS